MRLFLLLLFMITSGAGRAQEPAPPALLLDEAVTIALRHNPRLSAASRDVAAAQAGVGAARALSNPDIVLTPALTNVSGSSDEVTAQQPLELNGTRTARTGVAAAQARGASAQLALTRRDLVFETKVAYWELARARAQVAVARELLTSAQTFDRIARQQVEAGSRPGIDLAQTGLEVARAQRQTTLAEGVASAALAALNARLARPPQTVVGSLSPFALSPNAPSLDTALTRALGFRAELPLEEANRESFRQQARLARAEGIPDLAPQFRVGSLTRGLQPGSSGNGAGFGLGITLPLLDYGSRRARIRQADESARASQDRIAAVQNDIRQDVAQALARRQAASAVAVQFEGGVLDQAKRLLEGSRLGFQEGKTSVVAFLEAQRTYRTAQSEYADAQADAAVAEAALLRAIGEDK